MNSYIVFRSMHEKMSPLNLTREVALALLAMGMGRPPKHPPWHGPGQESSSHLPRGENGKSSPSDDVRLQEVELHYVIFPDKREGVKFVQIMGCS